MKIASYFLAVVIVLSVSAPAALTQKAPRKLPENSQDGADKGIAERATVSDDIDKKNKVRQMDAVEFYFKRMVIDNPNPDNEQDILAVCKVNAQREKMLRDANLLDKLDSELIATHDDWVREEKRLVQAVVDEDGPRIGDYPSHYSKQIILSEMVSSPAVTLARYRSYLKTSAAGRALDFHLQTGEVMCKYRGSWQLRYCKMLGMCGEDPSESQRLRELEERVDDLERKSR
jgi:hypothetical protein